MTASTQGTGLLMLLCAVLWESVAQLALKIGSSGGPEILAGRLRAWIDRLPGASSAKMWILAGVLSYGIEMVFYTLALNCLEVTVAFPLASLCFVGVAILSKFILGESVGGVRWIGIACVLAGTAFLAV